MVWRVSESFYLQKQGNSEQRDSLANYFSSPALCLRFPYQKPKWEFSSMAQQLLYAGSEDTYTFLSVGNAAGYAHWIHLWAGVTNKTRHNRGADFLSLPLSLSHTLPHLLLPLSAGESQPGPCILGKWAFIEPQFLPTWGIDWFASQCYSEAKDAESGVDLKLKNTTFFGATVQAKRSLKQFACISCWLTLHSLCCCC